MCQKAEGESNYLVAMDKSTRKRGWDAFHAGISKDSNPERTHPIEQYSNAHHWEMGWLTAQSGKQSW